MEENVLFMGFDVEYNFDKRTTCISESGGSDKAEFKNVELNEIGNLLKDACDHITKEYENQELAKYGKRTKKEI